jgi:hypothetical protein
VKKVIEIPMRDLEDLLDWHAGQVERFTKLKTSHETSGKYSGKYGASVVRGDGQKIDFHQRAVNVIQAALEAKK